VIPNEKIASDTIRNSSIRSRKKLAQVTVFVPLDRDLDTVIGLLREAAGDDEARVQVSDIDDRAHLTLSVWASDEPAAEKLASELRLKAHARLREAGVFA
jgi:small-conductance mechanosensitive channel